MDNELETLDSSTEEIETNDSSNVEPEPEKEEYTEREKQYFNRIKKLEAELEKKAQKKEEPVQNLGLSAGDLMAIKNADIEEKDMDLVEKFARDNGLPLREALHHPHMKAILAYEKEVRTTSVATNVENVRRGAVKVSDDTLITNASMNKLPTSDDEIEQLIHAKFKRR